MTVSTAVHCANAIEFETSLRAFTRECRPAGRGRPSKTGTRHFEVMGHAISVYHGETCRGAGSWGMSTQIMLDGKRASEAAVFKALVLGA